MRCFESFESFKKCLNFTPLIKEAGDSRFETLWEMSESSNLEYLGGGNLEQVGICMSQTKSQKSPPLRIMHARGQNYRHIVPEPDILAQNHLRHLSK